MHIAADIHFCTCKFFLRQIIPQSLIVDHQSPSKMQHVKNLCMSVYTQSRRLLMHAIPGRSLTGFGPAAAAEKVLKGKQVRYAIATVNIRL